MAVDQVLREPFEVPHQVPLDRRDHHLRAGGQAEEILHGTSIAMISALRHRGADQPARLRYQETILGVLSALPNRNSPDLTPGQAQDPRFRVSGISPEALLRLHGGARGAVSKNPTQPYRYPL